MNSGVSTCPTFSRPNAGFLTGHVVAAALFFVALSAFCRVACAEDVSSWGVQLEARFPNNVEIFSPQVPINLEVRPKQEGLDNPLYFCREIPPSLKIAVTSVSDTGTGEQAGSSDKMPALTEMELQFPVQEQYPWIPFSLLAPENEGVYEITITLLGQNAPMGHPLLGIMGSPRWKLKSVALAEKKLQFVVFDSTAAPTPAGDLLAWKQEMIDTADGMSPSWQKHLPSISNLPSLPKAGNLPTPLKPGLRPNLPRWGAFRERPKPEWTEPELVGEESPTRPSSRSLIPPGPLTEFLEQWQAADDVDQYGSGHFAALLSAAYPKTHPLAFGVTVFPKRPEPQEPEFATLNPSELHAKPSWHALPLALRDIGKPHLLELDYPLDKTQELSVAVVDMIDHRVHVSTMADFIKDPKEKSGSTTIPIVSAATGLHVVEEIVSAEREDKVATHRMLFWPRTKKPVLMLVNRSQKHAARFGKARLYTLEPSTDSRQKTKRLPKPYEGEAQRLVAAYLHDADFLEHLQPSTHLFMSAERQTPFCPGDWNDAFTGTARFVDHLHGGGYEGAMLPVVSNKGVLYPTSHFVAHTFLDTAFSEAGAIKDQLELLLLQADREKLALVPAIDFALPLREIEERLLENSALADEIRADSLSDSFRYNLLHPLVQEAMINAVKELTLRSASHTSFRGIAVVLSPDGYALLSPLVHHVDDWTFQAFQRELPPDASIAFPPELAVPSYAQAGEHDVHKSTRYASRARFIQSNPKAWEAWVNWRTRKVCDFYARLAQTVAQTGPNATLYLAGATMLDHPDILPYCTPSLLSQPSPFHILRMTGFDLSLLKEVPSLVFLRPSRTTRGSSADAYDPFCFPELTTHFMNQGVVPGTLLLHHHTDNDGLEAVSVQAGPKTRQRFVQQLVMADVMRFFDGGHTLPSVADQDLSDFLAAFRNLPAIPFQTFIPPRIVESGEAGSSLQPLTVRFAQSSGKLYVYLINASPFPAEAVLRFSPTTCSPKELGGRRTILPLEATSNLWRAPLDAYDFLAVEMNDPTVTIQDAVVRLPSGIAGANGLLQQKIDSLGRCVRLAQQGIIWDKLDNAGFEELAPERNEIIGWQAEENPCFTAQIDTENRCFGQNSLKLAGMPGTENMPGTLWSLSTDAPTTGRLFVSFHVGVSVQDASMRQIPLNVVLAGPELWFSSFAAGPQLMPLITQSQPGEGIRWQRMIVPFDRLPRDLEKFRLGFQLSGPGTVWIDDVTLYHVSFTPNEIKALQRLVLAATARCSQNRVSDLLAILEGHWAQFLYAHVPAIDGEMPSAALAAVNHPYAEKADRAAPKSTKAAVSKAAVPTAESPSFFDRVKGFFGR